MKLKIFWVNTFYEILFYFIFIIPISFYKSTIFTKALSLLLSFISLTTNNNGTKWHGLVFATCVGVHMIFNTSDGFCILLKQYTTLFKSNLILGFEFSGYIDLMECPITLAAWNTCHIPMYALSLAMSNTSDS